MDTWQPLNTDLGTADPQSPSTIHPARNGDPDRIYLSSARMHAGGSVSQGCGRACSRLSLRGVPEGPLDTHLLPLVGGLKLQQQTKTSERISLAVLTGYQPPGLGLATSRSSTPTASLIPPAPAPAPCSCHQHPFRAASCSLPRGGGGGGGRGGEMGDAAALVQPRRWATEDRVTLFLVNLASIMERADESLLPSVYHEVGDALGATPSGLGSLTLLRSIVQSLCYPLAVYMASRHDRARVIALGAFLWAGATFLVGISSTFTEVAISRALNGIGLALATPAIQSLVADSTDDSNRGMAFGWLQLTGNLGSILGGMFALFVASRTFMGIPGWRVAFHLVAAVSVVVGILVRLFAVDPHFSGTDPKSSVHAEKKPFKVEMKELIQEAKAVMKVPSFQVIIAQGVTGSFPWSALSFAPMWLELVGFSHTATGFLMGLFSVAGSFGALFGGYMGDYLSKPLPNSGRIILSQISSGSAVPLAAILFLALPDNPSAGFSYALVFFIMGLIITWNSAATNNPIFAEIVPERARTSIYALDRSFESVLASFAPPVVGLLAENVYGYVPAHKGASPGAKVERDRENATSLAKALYTAIAIPISLCCVIYSFLYCTYPRDRDRARMDSLIESELQQIELGNGGMFSHPSSPQFVVDDNERSVIEMYYGDGDFDVDVDDNDEATLLSRGEKIVDNGQ